MLPGQRARSSIQFLEGVRVGPAAHPGIPGAGFLEKGCFESLWFHCAAPDGVVEPKTSSAAPKPQCKRAWQRWGWHPGTGVPPCGDRHVPSQGASHTGSSHGS